MDKITRIHLAKIPYEIDNNAQIELKKYLEAIRSELDADLADDIMTDIEVRVTEILNDRNIKRNDVITIKDIDAIKEQLGAPEQFNDSETPSTKKGSTSNTDSKKLFRDMDGALIGGVASGLGAYLKIDPVIVRVIFIILLFFSGIGLLIYILLWVLVPPAKTSSDKLVMRGEPVTAAALQRYRSTAQRTFANLKLRAAFIILYKIFRVLFTLGVVIFILSLLVSVGLASAILYTQPLHSIYTEYHLNYLLLALFWLFIMTVIGLLVVMLLRLWHHRSSSLKIAFITFIGVMVLTIAGIAIVSPFIVNHYKDQYGGNKLTMAIPVNNITPNVSPTNLNLSESNLDVSYVVTNQPLHASYQAYPGMGRPMITVVNKSGTITLQTSNLTQVVPKCILNWCQHIYLPIKVTIYGPALQKFTVSDGAELDLSDLTQPNLLLVAQNNSNLNIDNSYSDNLSLTAESGASISAFNTTAQNETINIQNGSTIFGPPSTSLNVTLPVTCDQALLLLDQVPTSITLNNQSITSQAFSQNNCVNLDGPSPFSGDPFKNRRNLLNFPMYNGGPQHIH